MCRRARKCFLLAYQFFHATDVFFFQQSFRLPLITAKPSETASSMSKLDHSKLMIRPYWLDSNKALVKIVDKTFICFIYQVLLVRIQLGWKKIFCFVLKKQKWWYSHSQWCPILINTDSSMKLQKPTLSWKHTYWTQHFLYNKKNLEKKILKYKILH